MALINDGGYVHARLPWDGISGSDKEPSAHDSGARYRGWTLVDVGRYLYACNDETNRRLLVCRTSAQQTYALQRFREVVDAEEVCDA